MCDISLVDFSHVYICCLWCCNHSTICPLCLIFDCVSFYLHPWISLSLCISWPKLNHFDHMTASPFLYLLCLCVLVISLCVIIFFARRSRLVALICLCLPSLLWSNGGNDHQMHRAVFIVYVKRKVRETKVDREEETRERCTLFRYSVMLLFKMILWHSWVVFWGFFSI